MNRYESLGSELSGARERMAVPKADFEHPGLLVELQKIERSSIWSCCLKRHYARESRVREIRSDAPIAVR
jgi:hypothetical protein